MNTLWIGLAHVWRHRFAMLMPVIFIPVLFLLWSMGRTPVFEATTTLHLNSDMVQSPLLKNVDDPDHMAILTRTLKSEHVLEDVLHESGMLLNGSDDKSKQRLIGAIQNRLDLKVLENELIRINYQRTDKGNITQFLETLAFIFVSELLAPERFRTEQQLITLEEQIKRYGEQEKTLRAQLEKLEQMPVPEDAEAEKTKMRELVSLEFEIERLQAQKAMAQEEYDELLSQAKNLVSSYDPNSPNRVLWFVEPPVVITPDMGTLQHVQAAFKGLGLGFLLGLFLVWLAVKTDKSLKNDEQVINVLGVKVIGHLPSFGPLHLEKGSMLIKHAG